MLNHLINRIKESLIYIEMPYSTYRLIIKTNVIIDLETQPFILKFNSDQHIIDSEGYSHKNNLISFGAYKFNGNYVEYFHFKSTTLHKVN
jgi:hypothetical protein